MKYTLVIILHLLITFSGAAQTDYSGPAKAPIKSFYTYIDKLKNGTATSSAITNAERMINLIKEKDPSYDIASLTALLKPFKEQESKRASEKKEASIKGENDQAYFIGLWNKLLGVYSSGFNIEPGVTGKVYYERMKLINLDEYKQKKQTLGEIKPGSYINKIEEILADYDNYLERTDRLKWNVTEQFNKAKGTANPQEKMRILQEIKYECEAVLMLSPANTIFKQKLQDVNKLLNNAEGEAAKYFTSNFHKEHAGKIVWSTKPLIAGKENEMGAYVKNEFKTGDYIFGTVYLGNTLKQLMNNNDKLRVVIRVDGGTAVWGGDLSYFIVPIEAQDKSYFQFALLPDAQWLSKNYAPYLAKENWTISYFLDELVRSGDISHKISVELKFPTNIQTSIQSELLLDLNDGITDIKALSTKLHDQLMAGRTLPKAGMSNSSLEQQMVYVANNLGWNDKFNKAIITSSNWTIKKNELTGAVLYKYIAAVCTTKDGDGKCYYQEFTFRQDYTGSGYSSQLKFNSYGSKREIGCDKTK